MLRNVVVNHTTFFYPLGNTPAVCLTQDLPPELDADLLLLGCGDARSVLFTAYADAHSGNRMLDFTCCDIEPAIIARNILLYTLITDQQTSARDVDIWNIYYHFRIDFTAATLLQDQLDKLCALTQDLTTWSDSPYGKYMSFSNVRTFRNIHHQWQSWRYLNFSEDGGSEKQYKAFAKAINQVREWRKDKHGNGISLAAVRSAAPTGADVLADMPKLLERYWETGALYKTSEIDCVYNPTFSSTLNDGLVLHYGTEPLLGFHLATAYAPHLSKKVSADGVVPTTSTEIVVQEAQAQFFMWADAFRHKYGKQLTLRFVVADALSTAFSLQQLRATIKMSQFSWYCDSWTPEPLIFDCDPPGVPPSTFDVVDTSNLVDHLGPLNILLATVPLLKSQKSSALYTEVLVQHEAKVKDMLDGLLCGDFSTVALLMGLLPVEYLTNASMVSNVDEGMIKAVSKHFNPSSPTETHDNARQNRSRICWRASTSISESGAPITRLGLIASDMAQLLFGIYLQMFVQENVMSLISGLRLKSLAKISNPYYNRASFVALLCLVKQQVLSDWEAVLVQLLTLIEDDQSLALGKNYIQELYLYCHTYGVHSMPTYRSDFLRFCPSYQQSPLAHWNELPPVVALTFEVPRRRIAAFGQFPAGKLGIPALCCMLESPRGKQSAQWSNAFAAIQVGFGSIETSGSRKHEDYAVTIESDEKTWAGTSNMMVSLLVPTWVVLQDQDSQVFLSIQTTPHAAMTFNKTFPLLRIFETVLDSPTVHITKFMPNLTCHPIMLCHADPAITTIPSEEIPVTAAMIAYLDSSRRQINDITYRIDFHDQKLKTLLRGKSTTVEVVQRSAAQVNVILGKHGEYLHAAVFPVPVVTGQSKTRVARKSGYVEVTVPLASLHAQNRPSEYMFPVIPVEITSMGSSLIKMVVNWNAPFIDLDQLPMLDLSQASRLNWLIPHTSLMFSTREREIRDGKSSQKDLRADLKDGLFSILMQASGLQGTKAQCFALFKEKEGGAHVLIFVSRLRLDLGNHTVVLDAAVLPLTHDLMNQPLMNQVLPSLQQGHLCCINVGADELKVWKANLPAFVERCRKWSHDPNKCEYFKTNSVPTAKGLEDGNSSLCSCGIGRIPKDFMTEPEIPRLDQMIRKYAMRAAISPFFAVAYVEDCFWNLVYTGSERPKAEASKRMNSDVPRCVVCDKEKEDGKKLSKCSRCMVMGYCSAECQKKDWKTHKKICGQLKDIRERSEASHGIEKDGC